MTVSASDSQSGVIGLSFSNDGDDRGDWQSYLTTASWLLAVGDGPKIVYARVRDLARNVSLVSQRSIELNTSAGTESGLTINNGALFANSTAVTLTISAQPGISQMKISNDGGFWNAVWGPYTVYRPWSITQYGSSVIPRVVYLRFKDMSGTVSATYQDDVILDVAPPVGSVKISTFFPGLPAKWSQSGLSPNRIDAPDPYTYTVFLPLVAKSYCGTGIGPAYVTLNLQATDDTSGIGQMMIGNSPDFSTAEWIPFAITKEWHITGGACGVYAMFRDNAGNVSNKVSDTIGQ